MKFRCGVSSFEVVANQHASDPDTKRQTDGHIKGGLEMSESTVHWSTEQQGVFPAVDIL